MWYKFSSALVNRQIALPAVPSDKQKVTYGLIIRYGDGAIDYTDFCQRIMFDGQGMATLAAKINARFAELR